MTSKQLINYNDVRLWLNAEDTSSMDIEDTNKVVEWRDHLGGSLYAYQTDNTLSPVLASGYLDFGGYTTVRHMRFSTDISLRDTSEGRGLSFLIKYRLNSGNNVYPTIIDGTGIDAPEWFREMWDNQSPGGTPHVQFANGWSLAFQIPVSRGVDLKTGLTISPGTSGTTPTSCYHNGSHFVDSTADLAPNRRVRTIGSNLGLRHMKGRIYHILFFNKKLTANEMLAWMGHI